jgi:drug/metabolite transporter (DMT)-like permease
MVCPAPGEGADVRNRGIGRARIFVGEFLLLAAIILWGTALLMSPHRTDSASGESYIRATVAGFVSHSAIATLVLAALATWLLFPARRPRKPVRDWSLVAVIGVIAATGIYQLIWLNTGIFD